MQNVPLAAAWPTQRCFQRAVVRMVECRRGEEGLRSIPAEGSRNGTLGYERGGTGAEYLDVFECRQVNLFAPPISH
jgi:hypothetical protein